MIETEKLLSRIAILEAELLAVRTAAAVDRDLHARELAAAESDIWLAPLLDQARKELADVIAENSKLKDELQVKINQGKGWGEQ